MDMQRCALLVNPNLPTDNQFESALRVSGWQFQTADSTTRAQAEMAKEPFNVGVLVVGPETMNGQHDEIVQMLRRSDGTEWLCVSDRQWLEDEEARDLIGGYCFDFHTLPLDLERFGFALGHAWGMAEMKRKQLHVASDNHILVGESACMKEVIARINKSAQVDAPVLITGESGTGKELVARAIHHASPRRDGPFIAVNCAALPASLIQSELFGHEKGAFTGASARKIGRMEAADGGTIFLDEIGDLSPELQVNLLRFLQEKTIERIGGHESISLNVRVIAATHVDLEAAIGDGRFRADLFYRLNVLPLVMPPLREREGDIPLLAEHFFQMFSSESHPRLKGFSRRAIAAMTRYDWPGNVREFINRVRHAMVMCEHRLVEPADLGHERRQNGRDNGVTLAEARARADKTSLLAALRHHGYNVTRAAAQLGISRLSLYRLLEKYQIPLRSVDAVTPRHQKELSHEGASSTSAKRSGASRNVHPDSPTRRGR